MNYRVSIAASAEKELKGLPTKMVARIVPLLEALSTVPRPPRCRKLKGGDKQWRIRIGITGGVRDRRQRKNSPCDTDCSPARSVRIREIYLRAAEFKAPEL